MGCLQLVLTSISVFITPNIPISHFRQLFHHISQEPSVNNAIRRSSGDSKSSFSNVDSLFWESRCDILRQYRVKTSTVCCLAFLIDFAAEMLCDRLLYLFVVHEFRKQLLVLIHSINEHLG